MVKNQPVGDRLTKWLRGIACGIGWTVGAYWTFMLVVSAIAGDEPIMWEGVAIALLTAVTVVGIIVAWWREGLGGTIAAIGAIAFGIFAYFTAGHNKGFALLITGVPFLVSAILFLLAWWRRKQHV
jgi:hypothetical protein